MNTAKRTTSIEILRLISIGGIVMLHCSGVFAATASAGNRLFILFVNSIFNMGTTCFMLISGYFGLSFSGKKVVSLELMIIFYSLLDQALLWIINGSISINTLYTAVFPITGRRFWYMSVYMIILCCSPYLNRISEKLERDEFRNLLLILLLFFYIMPTFGYLEIMGDTGKGLANMLTVYLIGRYLRKYHDEEKSVPRLFVYGTLTILIGFTLNVVFTAIRGTWWTPFARDNSIIILLGSIFFFLAFKNIHFFCHPINVITKCVFGIYLFEGTVRQVLNNYNITLNTYSDCWFFPIAMIGYVLLIMTICIFFELIRHKGLSRVEASLVQLAVNVCTKLKKHLQNRLTRYG